MSRELGSELSREWTLRRLAELVGARVEGDPDLVVHGFNGLAYARPGELTFLLDRRQLPLPETCRASACIVPPGVEIPGLALIISEEPSLAAARIHAFMLERPFQATGVHPSAVIGADCTIPEAVAIGPLVCLGNGVQLGERVTLHPGVVLGDGVCIGDDSVLHANVTVAERCIIGNRVILHHGAVIGSDGFGFATDRMGRHHKKPQVGTVRIDDDVEIGANACVDRAAFGETRIRTGARIDNLVMVGHNVVIGEHSILVAQAGIAGSTVLGRNVVLGAKAGVAGHLHLEDRVMAAAMSGIHNNQAGGAMVGGCPAIEVKQWGRSSAVFSRLPEMQRELRRLRKEVERLGSLLSGASEGEEQ
ncbi:MAG: UDP-3-O-(3-hydroxymyristoyl)glucosamine N-acyltransferase [Desulfobulbus sp.]|jgi:UDP-3-O-[3-hydroxymyristoyl] glucosamine N-acyltransferase